MYNDNKLFPVRRDDAAIPREVGRVRPIIFMFVLFIALIC